MCNLLSKFIKFLFLALCFNGSLLAAESGGITIGGTRLIYKEAKKEVSLSVANSDSAPYLIQSWAETHAGGSDKAPFIVTPPLFRLEANQQSLLRIVKTGSSLPENKESLFWLNVKSIPSGKAISGVNTLQIAIKTRIKLIYRPTSVKGSPGDEAEKLIWRINGNKLTVDNKTPFIMNFQMVKVGTNDVKDATYVLPMSTATYSIPKGSSGKVSWKLINDYGGTSKIYSQE
ncbi:TPA: molecular chaperone [Klebsiella michiganensis]|nr:molecular chaperone [Klebsiella michiganensis]HCE8856097.1 molecular chaperone [Klebsiella michiganensis]HCE9042340.1 molecular chaperone [Klebsiella michiganensis]HCE9076400.1 molecular chaperone [Klebsiella michiganensis]